MSDFDKEAEREKLREQFAEDERKRQSTERMSELLLKGATMTNAHCDECGDPIFRWEGQEFCPSCAADGAVPEESVEAGQGGSTPDAETSPNVEDNGDATSIDIEAADAATGTPATGTDPDPTADRPGAGHADATPPADRPTGGHAPPTSTPSQPPTGGDTPASTTDPSPEAARPATGTAETPGLGEARAALTRTVTRFASQAEAIEDPARAREYLDAVADAADALAAVRDAER